MKPREWEAIQKAGWSSLEQAAHEVLANARGVMRNGMGSYAIAAMIARKAGTHIDPTETYRACEELKRRGLAKNDAHDPDFWRAA